MEVRPIRTEEDHRAALEEIDRLWNAPPGSPDADRLDVLATLVEAYEAQHHPILPPDPIEALRYYMDSRGITRRDLEEAIGYRGRVAEVLSRKRPLTLLSRALSSKFIRHSRMWLSVKTLHCIGKL